MSIPPESRNSAGSKSLLFDFLYNPFTVATLDKNSSQITLIARQRAGPTSEFLSSLISDTSASHRAPTTSLGIEGPYGIIGKHFEDLLDFGAGRILIIAGGVGATFALPVYRALLRDSPAAHVQLVWAIRTAGEATWAVSSDETTHTGSVLQDPHVQLFLTGDMGLLPGAAYDEAVDGSQGYEMGMATRSWRRQRQPGLGAGQNRKRPNLQHIIDDTFRQGLEEPVAVLVCGPAEMARETRRRVRPWAMRGRKIWWHDENFGW
jgi:NAD(P)H-flavin reductase